MLKHFLSRLLKQKDTNPEQAYDIWAANYDQQPENLMLALDEIVFSSLFNDITVEGKKLLDVGCGTGRHWKKIFDRHPLQLAGYDVSAGMLEILKKKFPQAITHQLRDDKLASTENDSIDLLFSTLTIAHIENVEKALKEWNRVTKPGSDIIITDYHPAILEKGGKRTFKNNNETIAVKNHVHSVEKIKLIAANLHWQVQRLDERIIDDSVKHYYEKQNALNVFESFKGMPVIYGIHFKKS